jgi:hypothetical protein
VKRRSGYKTRQNESIFLLNCQTALLTTLPSSNMRKQQNLNNHALVIGDTSRVLDENLYLKNNLEDTTQMGV